ncbi:hypothetical protein MRX96_020049 [Rhipicephalus microplus]
MAVLIELSKQAKVEGRCSWSEDVLLRHVPSAHARTGAVALDADGENFTAVSQPCTRGASPNADLAIAAVASNVLSLDYRADALPASPWRKLPPSNASARTRQIAVF